MTLLVEKFGGGGGGGGGGLGRGGGVCKFQKAQQIFTPMLFFLMMRAFIWYKVVFTFKKKSLVLTNHGVLATCLSGDLS